MQLRRLSPTSFWIEMPLSPQTSLLVWEAMATCGLRKGKINSYREEHFGLQYAWQDHLVEGRTAEALFDARALLQAKLSAQDGGTLLEFAAANINRQFDFGSSRRVKRRLVPRIVKFLRKAPADWTWHRENIHDLAPPIASPSDSASIALRSPPNFEIIVPIRPLPAKQSLQVGATILATGAGAVVASRLHLLGLVLLALAGWELWNWRTKRRKFEPFSFSLYAALGIYNLWIVIRHWF